MRIAQKIAFISLLFFTVLLSSFLPSNSAHADVLSIGVKPKWTNWAATWQYLYYYDSGNSGWVTYSANTITPTLSRNVNQIRFSLPNGLVLQSGDYITAEMVYNLEAENNSNDMIFGSMMSNTSGVGLIDVSVTRGSNTMGTIKFTFKVETTISVSNTSTYVTIGSARGGSQYNIFWFNENAGYLQGSIVNFYGIESVTDYTGGINSLNTGVTNLNSKLNTTNQKLDDVKNEIKSQSEQQQEQYESEKEEESQREEDMNGQAEDAQGIFNFNVINPFSVIFNSFKANCTTAEIPTLGSWLHLPSEDRFYPCWWSSNHLNWIRTGMTNSLNFVGIMILFGFVISWLRNNGSGGGTKVTYEDNSPAPINSKVTWSK